jgi:hypothetical protein
MRSPKLTLLAFALLIVPNVGCQTWYGVRDTFYFCEPIDECFHTYHCNRAAKAAWAARMDRHCDRACLDHFGAGFRAGYADVANGGTGCPPPLPPRRYWGWRYKNCEGQQCVAGWFDGYPAGARAAEEDGVANWSRMQTSYVIDAQYAARMSGSRRGGPIPPGAAFPGEELLEEVPAAAGAADSAIPVPAEEPVQKYVPGEYEAEPLGNLNPSLKNRTSLPPVIKKKQVTEPVAAVEEPVVEASGTEAAETTPVIRQFDMPAVEILSGLSVPKKDTATAEPAPEMEIVESVDSDDVANEQVEAETANTVPPSESTIRRLAPGAGVIAETPEYSLNGDSEMIQQPTEAKPVSDTRRTLPPIVPSKVNKQPTPVVRPVEESGRTVKLSNAAETKQVSYEADSAEEAPVLRRLGQTK